LSEGVQILITERGGQLVAQRVGSGSSYTTTYVHQDSLGSTSLVTDSNGAQVGTTMKYLPFGLTQTGSVNTTKEFTGQRLDSTGLYYYNARYYDPAIGRFISADTVIQNLADPQSFNRYSYCTNNPLKYTDPSGHIVEFENETTCMNLINSSLDNGTELSSDQLAMVNQWADLRNGWYTLSTIDHEETQKLENDSAVIYISWAPANNEWRGVTMNEISASSEGHRTLISADIFINKKYSDDLNYVASIMGHEGFHTIADINGFGDDTRLEEVYAMSIGLAVWDKLDYSPFHGFLDTIDDVTPNSSDKYIDTYLKGIRWTIYPELLKLSLVPPDRNLLKQLYVQYYPR